ncbi:hypothetical protein A0H81_09876 [Grifola frondosa]|uniref:Uncharacterized protein n=1 Tax=Grifola frondosa TaxID=5627 RepID=A0A1C7LZR7_GRIFR|nr:hypothetical protein A0H81_09876 [Grifola frondosa]
MGNFHTLIQVLRRRPSTCSHTLGLGSPLGGTGLFGTDLIVFGETRLIMERHSEWTSQSMCSKCRSYLLADCGRSGSPIIPSFVSRFTLSSEIRLCGRRRRCAACVMR